MDCCYISRTKAIVLLSAIATIARAQAEKMDTITDIPHLSVYLVPLMVSYPPLDN